MNPLEAFLYTLAILLTGYCIGRHTTKANVGKHTTEDKVGVSKEGGKVKKTLSEEHAEMLQLLVEKE